MRLLKVMIAIAAMAVLSHAAPPLCTLGVSPAYANSCTQQCRNRHNQCRITTKGSSRCDAMLRRCLRRCLN